ncbi:MAG: hydrogenase maturation nickel metallochaperone HypA [Fuerstiella sp.]
MHEESLVRSLLRQVESIAAENNAAAVTDIEVEIGPLSGVESLLVTAAFERLVADTACRGATLTIRQIGMAAACEDCGTEFGMVELLFCCPSCGASRIRILRGDEFRLMNIELEISSDTLPSMVKQ